MSIGSDLRRATIGATVGFAYGSILARLSFLAMGAGHGTFLPFWLSSAPLGAFGFFGDFGVYAAVVGGAPAVCRSVAKLGSDHSTTVSYSALTARLSGA